MRFFFVALFLLGFTSEFTWSQGGPTAVFTWDIPAENTDGSPYTDGAGFRIYARADNAGAWSHLTDVNDPGATTTTVALSPSFTHWEFYITAYSQKGLESPPSQSVQATIIFPNAPGGFTCTVQRTVAVGGAPPTTVSINVPCE